MHVDLEIKSLIYALLFGIIPALIWLKFWLLEDRKRPEPRGRIFAAFIGGMIIVPIAIFLERMMVPEGININTLPAKIIIGWSVIEEFLKYGASWVLVLRTKDYNEPIDPMIYLITTALGFAAMENALFVLEPIQNGLLLQSIITGNMRFIGATLLHVLASGTLGAAIAFSFYRNNFVKGRFLWAGLILAVSLHALFNFFIIKSTNIGIFLVFGTVWILVIFMILIFEKVKAIKK